jgi:hypothetical protein
MVKKQLVCEKCGSNKITITWKYKKENEMAMLLCHDGWGLQFEDSIMRCAECKCKKVEVK